MGLHKLEIEVSEALLKRIDKVSAETGLSREEVVVNGLEDHLPEPAAPDQETIEQRRSFLKTFSLRSAGLRPGRSRDDIDRQVRAFREDGTDGR